MSISPSGTKLLFISASPSRTSVVQVIDLATKVSKPVAKSDGTPEYLRWCEFASDTHMVCKFGGNVAVDNDIAGFSRLVGVPVSGGKVSELGQPANYYLPVGRQYDGDILDWLPDTPGSVLMQRTYVGENSRPGSHIADMRDGMGVDRIDLASLKSTTVEAPRKEADGFLSDGRGGVRIMETAIALGETRDLTGVIKYRYRKAGSKEWLPFVEYDLRTRAGAVPIAVEAGSDSAFMLKRLNGRDALYRAKLDGSGASNLVASNPKVDIDGIVRIGRGQRVIGYTYATEGREIVYFDAEFDKLASSLSAALPGHPAVTFEGASADGTKLIVLATSDTQPGMFYLFDKATKHLDEVAPVRPELEGRVLAPVKPVSIPTADGAQIPAYLTVPAGVVAKNLPAVLLPHGGPSARDEWGFDWLAQFLAARGYAVIQPNFRGSAGYGAQWEGNNGFKDWQKAVGDISSSARWLTQQGIADPKRLAIVGWSYGGYAALQSAATDPDLYKAAIAIAPVTDLGLLKDNAVNFTNWRLIDDLVGNGPNVELGSPARRAVAVKVPVLLIHGDLDANVSVRHSDKMLGALKAAGKSAELMRFKGLAHQLDDSTARATMLTRIGEFLDASFDF